MRLSGKRILITGGAGFIGSALAQRFLDENAHVFILDDFSLGTPQNVPVDCVAVRGDVSNYSSFEGFKDVDYVFHYGAPSSAILFDRDPERCLLQTIVGLMNAFEFAATSEVRKVVYPTSSSVYGNIPLPQSEDSPTHPVNLYGIGKLICEHLARLYSDRVPSVGFRIFAGYGPGEGHKGEVASVATQFLKAIGRNSAPVVFGDGTQSRDFVYVDDIVEANIRSIDQNLCGVINLGTGQTCSYNRLIGIINELLGTEMKPVFIAKPQLFLEHTQAETGRLSSQLNIFPCPVEIGLGRYIKADGWEAKG